MAQRQGEGVRGGRRDVRTALQRYQLHGIRETGEELGRGSYAAVIEVDYKGLRCAAKKIYSILARQGDRLVTRFEEECRLLGELRHPNIVQFLGIYFDTGTDLPVLVMEFLPTTLAQCVERYGRLPTDICYAILRDVALGVRYLHEQRPRVIHRDLSANNVLLTGDIAAKISDLGVAKILQINPTQMSHMTQTPGTQSYMPPEALRPNPRYDVEVDVFSFGVMLVHVLSGQWPLPSEATQVDPCNPAGVIGVSEVERRAEYLNIIGRPSDEQEGHPLVPLIERCLSNSPNLRPIASELVERMNDAVTQQPLTFSNRVDMMQRIDSIQRDKEALQTQVSMLEGQVERGGVAQREQREQSQRQEMALGVKVEQLRLQVSHLEAEKTHIVTTATAREELHHTEMQARDRQHQEQIRWQQEHLTQQHKGEITAKETQFQAELRKLQDQLDAKARQHEAELVAKDIQYQTELSKLHDQLNAKARHCEVELAAKDIQHKAELSNIQSQLKTKEAQHQAEVKLRDNQLQVKTTELSSQSSLLSEQRSTIEGLHSQLQQARQCLTSGSQIHAFSPNAGLVWRECASIPAEMVAPTATFINGRAYVGGGNISDEDVCQDIYKYDPMKDEWNTLPPAPVGLFGIGQLNGKLVVVGRVHEEEDEIAGDVHVFEEDTQQWVKSIPPLPTGLYFVKVACHSSALVVCGMPEDTSSPTSLFVYNSQSSQWHSRAPPLTFISGWSSAVIMNGNYYLAPGVEGGVDSETSPSSPAVFSLPLSTLLDPNTPQDPSSWQRMPDMPCHTSHLATTGGCLLALGGLMEACNLGEPDNLELSTAVNAYCPATSSWVKIGDIPDQRLYPVITTLSSGELFIAGGVSPDGEHKKVFIGIIK